MYLRLTITILALLWAGAGSATEGGSPTLAAIAERGAMRIGYRVDSPPFSYEDAQGNPVGYSVDLCRAIASEVERELGLARLDLEFVRLTAEERLVAVVNGEVDIECGTTTNTLSRQRQVDFTHIVFVTGGTLLSRKSRPVRLSSELAGRSVAVLHGTTTERALASHLETAGITARVVTVNDRAEGMALLGSGKVDAFASDRLVLLGQVEKSTDPQQYVLADDFFSYEPYAFAVRRNDADFRLVANRALSGVFRSQQIGKLYRKWFAVIGARPSGLQMAVFQLQALPE